MYGNQHLPAMRTTSHSLNYLFIYFLLLIMQQKLWQSEQKLLLTPDYITALFINYLVYYLILFIAS